MSELHRAAVLRRCALGRTNTAPARVAFRQRFTEQARMLAEGPISDAEADLRGEYLYREHFARMNAAKKAKRA